MFGTVTKAARPAPPAADAGFTPCLLVVDDDTVHRMIITRIGAKAGYAPAEVSSYDAAAEILRSGREFDCITLDLSLGQRGGADVLKLIAGLGLQTPIIIISGSEESVRNETLQMADALAVNVFCLMPKPVDLAELRNLFGQVKVRLSVGLVPAHVR
jgi:two-component system, chemotaxis family, chemotaxis protein CheY